MEPGTSLDRRAFAASLAAGAAALAGCGAPPVAPPVKIEETPTAKLEPPKAEPPMTEPPKAEPPKTDPPEPVAETSGAKHLLRLLQQTYADHPFEPEHLEVLESDLEKQLVYSEVLSKAAARLLTNADEPAPVFGAYRGPD